MDLRASLTERIAQSIQAAMEREGFVTKTLAPASGIPYTTLFRKLGGHKAFTTAELEQIGAVLGVEPSAFLVEAQARAVA